MKKCKVQGCNDKHYCKGLCQRHYMQYRRGTLNEPIYDTDLLLDKLMGHRDTIHTMKELFTLLDDLILSVSLDESNEFYEILDEVLLGDEPKK